MPETYVKYAGLDWPKEANEHSALLQVARFYHIPLWIKTVFGVKAKSLKEIGCTIPPDEALLRVIDLLFPKDLYKMNPWSEKMITAFAGNADFKYPEVVVQASAGASKSETFGLLGLLYFLTAPQTTTTRFVSTDIKGLRQRSFGAVTKYFNHLRKMGPLNCVFSRQTLAIILADEDNEDIASSEQKAGVFAFALKSGTLEDGIAKVIGTHWPQPTGGIMLVADEAENVPEAWFQGLSNLYIATTDIRLVSLGNPTTLTGGLADRAEPKEGWGSVTIEDEEWETRRGAICLHLDGEKSPAIAEPDEYPFLINQQSIDRTLADCHGRKEASGYVVMVRGWMPTVEGYDLLIPMSIIRKFRAEDPVVWARLPEYTVAGFDPGYGGDAAVLQVADVGWFSTGVLGLAFREPFILDIQPESEVPVQYQMYRQIERYRRDSPFPLSRMAIDESGLQRCGDTIELESGESGLIRVSFGVTASSRPVSALDDTPANRKYGNQVTEMWAALGDLIRFEQVKSLPREVARELSMRCILSNKRPLRLESKADLKKRLKRSPDNADAAALATIAALLTTPLVPGATAGNLSGVHGRRAIRGPYTTSDYQESSFAEKEFDNG